MKSGESTPWKYPVTVGVAFRVIINVASPSHEAATGEYTEHKKAPIYYGGRTYLDVPIISGNALRRYVKEALIVTAEKHGLPIGNLCRKGIFTHWNTKRDLSNDVGIGKLAVNNVKDCLRKCVMEDAAGFMYAEKDARRGASIVRFSRLHVATMKPTYESLSQAKVYPIQFARHVPGKEEGKGKSGQMVFRVEHISGEFAGLVTLDAHLLGFDDYTQQYFVKVPDDVVKRAEAVLEAMYIALNRLGAMKARSMTVGDVTSLTITVAQGLFTPTDPARRDYIESTVNEAQKYEELTGWKVNVITYPQESAGIAEAFTKAKEKLGELLRESLAGGSNAGQSP